jgi:hypothetical protein
MLDATWKSAVAAVVDGRGVVRGTAFFVGDDVALTCAHVLEAAGSGSVTLRRIGSSGSLDVLASDVDEGLDLALVGCRPRPPNPAGGGRPVEGGGRAGVARLPGRSPGRPVPARVPGDGRPQRRHGAGALARPRGRAADPDRPGLQAGLLGRPRGRYRDRSGRRGPDEGRAGWCAGLRDPGRGGAETLARTTRA